MTLPPALSRVLANRRGDMFARLMALDEQLTAKGFPPISPWWRDTLRDFYASGKRRLVLRVGRRGGKSSTLSRVVVAEALWGGHVVPPGDLGVFPIVSVGIGEASKRLITIKSILDAIGVGYGPIGDRIQGIQIEGRPIAFQIFAATISGVSGFTGIGNLCDEMAKWADRDTGANPATQVIRSLKPTMATQPHARSFWCSSPFSTLDAHCAAFDEGVTEDQAIAYAPTWEANPTISEEQTHAEERDEGTWRREYKAIPMSSTAASFFDGAAIDAAAQLTEIPMAQSGAVITAGADMGFQSDSSALVTAIRIGEWDGPTTMHAPLDLVELRPEPDFPLRPGNVVAHFAAKLADRKLDRLMADGHYRMSIIEHLEERGLGFLDAPTGILGKAETYVRTRVLLNGGRLALPKHDRLLGQLREIRARPTLGGALSIDAPRKAGHGDLVSALVLALWQRHGYEVPGPAAPEEDRIAAAIEERLRREREGEWWDRY